jgi:hypothetical protein
MSRTSTRAAWAALLAAGAGGLLVLLVTVATTVTRPTAALIWFLGAAASYAWIWREEATRELRFTSDGASALAWLCAFFLPPVGIAIGAVLWRRGSAQGLPMILVSLAALAVYALIVAGNPR